MAYSSSYALAGEKIAQPPELKVTPVKKQAPFAMRGLPVFLLIVALVTATVYYNMELVEVADLISTQQAELDKLVKEGKSIQVEIDSSVSLRTVEEQATDMLGMAKMEPYQVEYLSLGQQDRARIMNELPPTFMESVKSFIGRCIDYISF